MCFNCLAKRSIWKWSASFVTSVSTSGPRKSLLRASKAKFLQYAHEEQTHARHIVQRIIELEENPNLYHPEVLSPRHNMSVELQSFMDMMIDDVIAARIAIDTYQKLLVCVATDPTTRQLVNGILADKQKHAEELLSCMRQVAERDAAEGDQPPFSGAIGKRWSAAGAAP